MIFRPYIYAQYLGLKMETDLCSINLVRKWVIFASIKNASLYFFLWRHYSERLLVNEALDAYRQHGKLNFKPTKGHNDPNIREKCGQRRQNISSYYGLHLFEATTKFQNISET